MFIKMNINLNRRGLNRAFNKDVEKKEEVEKIKIEDNKPENYKIANFVEELKERANYNGMDIVFVLDTTASMSAYIEGAKESIRTIIADAQKSLQELEQPEDSLKFSMVAYRDHPPEDPTYVTNVCDFTDSVSVLEFMNKLTADGGGDGSEAVLDGLYDAIYNVKWRENSEKFLFLVLDWPPHGKRFNSSSDNFPDGCPCGYHEKDLLPKLREMMVDFTIIKIADYINTMIELFSQYINIDVHQPKIFAKKNSYTYSGTEGMKLYEESVKTEMKKACASKVNRNLDIYMENKKAKNKLND
jgi:hypothetical protein